MLSIQERSAAVRYSITTYGSDGDNAEPETIGPFYDHSEAEARAESLAYDGIEATVTAESVGDFVQREAEWAAINEKLIERKLAEIRQLGRRGLALGGFASEARRIGQAFGQSRGLLASNWEPWLGLDNQTRQRFGNGPDADLAADLAELYAEVAFWQARATMQAMRRADGSNQLRVLTA